MDEKQIQALYDAMNSKLNLGSYQDFKSKLLSDDNFRKSFHDEASQDLELGDYNSFSNNLKKKEGGVSSVPTTNISAPSSPAQSPSQSSSNADQQQPTDFSGQNPIDLAKQAKELSQQTIPQNQPNPTIGVGLAPTGSGGTNQLPDINSIKKANDIEDYLKKEGYDKNVLNSAASLPDDYYNALGISKDDMLQEIKQNPTKAQQVISSAKWQIPLQQEIQKKDGQQGLVDFQAMRNAFSDISTDYATKRKLAPQLLQSIRENAPDAKTMHQWINEYSNDAAQAYGSVTDSDPTLISEQEKYPNLDLNQVRALNWLQDTQPDKAQVYKAALVDPKLIKDNYDAQTGQEEQLTKLSNIGLTLRENSIKADDLSQGNSQDVKDQLNQLQDEKNSLLIKYPKAGINDAESFAQELLGQKNTGLNWLALQAGQATGNAWNSVVDLATEPFRSETNSNIHQLSALGDLSNTQTETGTTQKNQVQQSFTPTLSKDLKVYVDQLNADKTLTDKQKSDMLTTRLMRNPDEWQRTPIEGGKTNIGLTSLLYGTGSLAANLAPYVLAETATGGGATAGLGRKFTSSFVSMMGTSFHEAYQEAIKNGETNPYAYALGTTAINSAAMAGAQTPEAIRDLLSGTKSAASDLVSKMTDKEILSALRDEPATMGAFKKGLNLVKKTATDIGTSAVKGVKTAAKITPFITAGNVVNDALSGDLKEPSDYLKQAAIEGLKFSVLGTALGTIGKIGQEPNELNKAALYQAAQDPDSFLSALEQKQKSGAISKEEAEQVKNNIEGTKDVMKTVPMVDVKGNPLGERDRRNLLFLKMQENDLEGTISKDIPESLQVAMQKRLSGVQDKIDKLYNGTLIDEPNNKYEAAKAQAKSKVPNATTEAGTSDKGTNQNIQPAKEVSPTKEGIGSGVDENKWNVGDVIPADPPFKESKIKSIIKETGSGIKVELENGSKTMLPMDKKGFLSQFNQGDKEDNIANEEKHATSLKDVLNNHENSENATDQDLVRAVESHIEDNPNDKLQKEIDKYWKADKESKEKYGDRMNLRGEAFDNFQKVLNKEIEKEPTESAPIEKGIGSGVEKGFTSEAGNKVVDEKGKPLSVYHRTNGEFDKFDEKKKGTNTGWDNTVHGFFFADKPENTEQFGKNLIEANINLKKPIDLRYSGIFNNEEQAPVLAKIFFDEDLSPKDALEKINDEIGLGELSEMKDALNSKEAHDAIVKAGYDGIISDMGNNQNEYIVFDKDAIKIKSKNGEPIAEPKPIESAPIKQPIESQNKTNQNATDIRSNQGQSSTGGNGPESSQDEGGKNIQLNEVDKTKPAETEQQAGQENKATGEEENKVGIRHESLTKLAKKLGLEEPKRGIRFTPEQFADRGRQLLNAGADIGQLEKDFKEGKQPTADDISVARAHLEDLKKIADAMGDKWGVDSKQYKEANKDFERFSNEVAKPMGTAASEPFTALQGERDINTGSFTSLRTAFKESSGSDELTPDQERVAKKLSDDVKAKDTEIEKLKSDLKDAWNKVKEVQAKADKATFTEKAKKIAENFRKLKTKPFVFKDKEGNEIPIEKMGVSFSWNDMVELGAKAIEKTGEIADGVAAIIEKIKDSDRWKDFDDSQKKDFEKQLTDHYKGSLEETPEQKNIKRLGKKLKDLQDNKLPEEKDKRERSDREKELHKLIDAEKERLGIDTKKDQRLKNLQKKLDDLRAGKINEGKEQASYTDEENKVLADIKEEQTRHLVTSLDKYGPKDLKFTPEEAKGVWDHITKNYLDKGVNIGDAVSKTSDDLGITENQVMHAIAQPKGAKAITDEMWRKNYQRRLADARAKAWVKSAGDNHTWRHLMNLANLPGAIATAYHGPVVVMTHAGMDLYRPGNIKNFIELEGNGWANAFGDKAKYEQKMNALVNDPTFPMWKKAKLVVDPNSTHGDDFTYWSKLLKKWGENGIRAFNAIKMYRLQQANMILDKVNPEWKYNKDGSINEDVLKTIAEHVNLSTGTTKLSFGDVGDAATRVLFAPKLVASQIQRILTEPTKALANTALWAWGNAKPEQKLQAKLVWSKMGTQMATYATLLAANSAILSLTGSNQKINYTDPTREDWLKIKGFGWEMNATAGTLPLLRFFAIMGLYAKHASWDDEMQRKEKPGEEEGKKLTTLLRGKESPAAQVVSDYMSGTDVMGRPTPWSNVPLQAWQKREGITKHTWGSYIGTKMPIFIADGFQAAEESAMKNGMPKTQFQDIVKGIFSGIEAGTFGARVNPDYSLEKRGSGGGGGNTGNYKVPTLKSQPSIPTIK